MSIIGRSRASSSEEQSSREASVEKISNDLLVFLKGDEKIAGKIQELLDPVRKTADTIPSSLVAKSVTSILAESKETIDSSSDSSTASNEVVKVAETKEELDPDSGIPLSSFRAIGKYMMENSGSIRLEDFVDMNS